MSPYSATCLEVCQALGTSLRRLEILHGWLLHRDALRAIGFLGGFQWLDGSFVEDKVPNDLDLVTFFHPPQVLINKGQSALDFLRANNHLFDRDSVRQAFTLDALWVDLSQRPETIVRLTRYWFGLFSHRRVDDLWKGMLEVPLLDPSEGQAAAFVTAGLNATAGGGP